MRVSYYKDNVYFLKRHEGKYILVKMNPSVRKTEILRLDMDGKTDYQFVAVNKFGIFLYNTQIITLFSFGGEELYSYDYGGRKDKYAGKYEDCVYIYGQKFYYSETKQSESSCFVWCVDMMSREKTLAWKVSKGDDDFEDLFRKEYYAETGRKVSSRVSVINSMKYFGCRMLYVNSTRLIIGVAGGISFVVSVERSGGKQTVLQCDLSGEGMRKEENPHIFSFDMLEDRMTIAERTLVRRQEDGMPFYSRSLIISAIGKLSETRYGIPYDVLDSKSKTYNWISNREWVYFDGKQLFYPDYYNLYAKLRNDGSVVEVLLHPYRTKEFYVCGKYFYVPDEYAFNGHYVLRSLPGGNNDSYEIHGWDLDPLIQKAFEVPVSSGRNALPTHAQKTTDKSFDLFGKNVFEADTAKSIGSSAGKTKKMKLGEMIALGILSVGDLVYVKGRPDQKGRLAGGDKISYYGLEFSLNQYVSAVLGPGSRNAYLWVYVIHNGQTNLLDELR